jgi:predicted small metal-binding protein
LPSQSREDKRADAFVRVVGGINIQQRAWSHRSESEKSPMARQINCECGYVARGETDDEVIELIERHVRSDHPELVETETREEIAKWIEVVE